MCVAMIYKRLVNIISESYNKTRPRHLIWTFPENERIDYIREEKVETLTVPLKGKYHKKNDSEVPSMDSFTKIYIDLKKL